MPNAEDKENGTSNSLRRAAKKFLPNQQTLSCSRTAEQLEDGMHLRYAKDDGGNRISPSPGLTGFCENCGGPVISKCGRIRIHHFAHRGERDCDTWHEPITAWHTGWQGRFHLDWREVSRVGLSGAKHIADVFTPHGLTIEFQHSYLAAQALSERESFYGNMVWVVDAHQKTDLPKFLQGARYFTQISGFAYYLTPYPQQAFPPIWLDCRAPVFFDFGHSPSLSKESLQAARSLWCLLPGRVGEWAVVVRLPRDEFVRRAHDRAEVVRTVAILKKAKSILEEAHRRRAVNARVRADPNLARYLNAKRLSAFRRTYPRS